ncbi:L-seryl-tRNA(Sec) selenium transferase [Barrientosiimonas endolithica]|uniref:L-seryl-tRNA(Sec) selenium transferase n=1 Tax=Barrientosiimonas endolithica TaxID=1535208 RepID=A0ABN6YUS4_9MICO|nr:L-seryl-tRNA(Sec) selenium transferase [Barrientosiimonas endolithica]BDZ59570.1 L-seryl-tRNA(Sec) selenium transferase [Barrientosiimonas endolithica]
MTDPRRATPRTDTVLADPALAPATARLGRDGVRAVVRDVLDRCRAGELSPDEVVPAALEALPTYASSLRPVINATGVVVHTNLGRAPLSALAREAVVDAAGTTDVELDLATGRRGRRGAGALAALAERVPDAEAVHVVNNGAAALALAAACLAGDGREILVARGELVEIGDGFRIPELLESTGARLREVGTTNRVRLADYTAAVNERTAFVLKVHPSNFVVRGFTSSVPVRELAGLRHDGAAVPLVADIGSGLLAPHPRLPDEPDAASTLRAGAGLVTASGDKLLGGPQAGLLLGRAEQVERVRRFPLARAMRVDKLTLAALEATLRGPEPPVLAALATPREQLRSRAVALAGRLGAGAGDAGDAGAGGAGTVRVVETTGAVGGGGAPEVPVPSVALALPAAFAEALRGATVPVVARVVDGQTLVDLLAVAPDDDDQLLASINEIFSAATVLEGSTSRTGAV